MSVRAILVGAVLAALMGCRGGARGFCKSSDDCGGAACENGVCQGVGGGQGPVVSAIDPDSGPAGTIVVIQGSNFSAVPGEVVVRFGDAPATVVGASATTVQVTVPPGIGEVAVTVEVAGRKAEVEPTFKYAVPRPPPTVSGIDPPSGTVGAMVRISGSGFVTTPDQNSVWFGDVQATVETASSTELVVAVPTGTGTVPVKVAVAGRVAANQPSFTYESSIEGQPYLASISPVVAPAGTIVAIKGGNFGSDLGAVQVFFGSTATTPRKIVDPTELRVVVPQGTGVVDVTVSVAGAYAVGSLSFGYAEAIEIRRLASLPAGGIFSSGSSTGDYVAFAVGSRGYVVNVVGVIYEYDPVTNGWAGKTPTGGEQPWPGIYGFATGTMGYVGFGNQSVLAAYDPSTDRWATLDAALPEGYPPYRPYGAVLVDGSTILVTGPDAIAMNAGTLSGESLQWGQPMPFPFDVPFGTAPLAFSLPGKAYWGGLKQGVSDGVTDSFYRLDPAGRTWTQLAALPAGMERYLQPYVFTIGTRAYVMNAGRVWIFSEITEAWRSVTFSGMDYDFAASFTIDDKAYLLFPDGAFYSLKEAVR